MVQLAAAYKGIGPGVRRKSAVGRLTGRVAI